MNKQSIGYMKNRTKQYMLIKQKVNKRFDEVTACKPCLPPAWVDKLEETRDLITRVGQVSNEIENLKSRRDAFSEQKATQKLDMAMQMVQDIEDNIQKMEEQEFEDEEDYKMQQNARMCLAILLKDVTPQLRTYQREMLQQVYKERPMAKFQMDAETEYIESLILDRNDRIKQLGEKIKKMAELFQEMNRMVIEQGTLLDRIDFNLEKALTIVTKGKQQLVQADQKQQTGSRAQKCLCILIGLNIDFIICIKTYFILMRSKSNATVPFPVAVNRMNHHELPLLGRKKKKIHTKNPFKTKIYYIPDDTIMPIRCLDGFLLINLTKNDAPHEILRADLSRKRIQSSKPEDFPYFMNLEELDVSENQLLLDDLTSFPSLKILRMAANNLRTVELSSRNTFDSLKTLDLSFNYLTKESISYLKFIPELEELHLVNNELQELPTDMHEFKRLQTLDISDNNFQSNQYAPYLWETLGQIQNLKYLNIAKNFLRGIHTERLVVGYFGNLEVFDFSYNIAENQHNLICARNFINLQKIIVTGNPFAVLREHKGLEMEIHARTGGILINEDIERPYLKKAKVKKPQTKFEQLKRVENDLLKLPTIEQQQQSQNILSQKDEQELPEEDANVFMTEQIQTKQTKQATIPNSKPSNYEDFKKFAQEVLGDSREYEQHSVYSNKPALDLTTAYQKLKSVINKPDTVDYEDFKEPNYMKPTVSIPRYKYQIQDDQPQDDEETSQQNQQKSDINLDLQFMS